MSNEQNEQFKQPNFASDKWTQDYIAATGNGPLRASGKPKEEAIAPEAVPTPEPHVGWTARKLAEVGLFEEEWDSSMPVEELGDDTIQRLRKQAFDKFADELRSRGISDGEIAFYAQLNNITGYPLPEAGVTLSMDREQFDKAMEEAMEKLDSEPEVIRKVPKHYEPEEPVKPNFEKAGAEVAQAVLNLQSMIASIGKGYAEKMTEGMQQNEEPGTIWTEAELERQERFMQVCEQACALFMVKNREYRNAIKHTGAVGSAIVMTGDIAKLRSLLLYKLGDIQMIDTENASDKFQDVLVQAVIGIMMLEDGNILGEDADEI